MIEKEKFSLAKRLRSFGYAFQGLKIMIQSEHNFRIHVVAAIIAIILGFFYTISSLEWIAICFAIGLVFALEIFNSAIEKLADFVSPDKHESIKTIKDLAAAAVFIGAISALFVGIIIFLPKMFCFCFLS